MTQDTSGSGRTWQPDIRWSTHETTHWATCWNVHHDCAAARIRELVEMLQRCEAHCSDGWVATEAQELLARIGWNVVDEP